MAGTVYGGRARSDPEGYLGGAMARFANPPSLAGYLAQLYAIAGWSSLAWLPRIAHPTLVLAGDDDPIVPLVNARILTRSIPQARLHVLKGGGHLFLLDQPEESAEVVVDFLTERD